MDQPDLDPTSGPAGDAGPGGGPSFSELIRSVDWAGTPLGPREEWPPALETAVGIALASPDPVAVWWGREFAVVYNEAYAEILGDRHPRALGRPRREVWPEVFDALQPVFQRVVRRGGPARFEDEPFEIGLDRARETRWFTFTLSAIPDGHGGIGGVLNLVQETTETVRARKKLEEAEVHVMKSQRLESVSKLAGAVAHEFNNVLTVLEGRADVLLGEIDEDSPLREDVRAIVTAGRRATSLTDRLLAFGRQQPFRESVFDLDEVVLGWADQLARMIPDSVDLRVHRPSEPVPVRADPTQIERVMFELVSNSVQAMDGRGGTIELGVRELRLTDSDAEGIPWEVAAGAYAEATLTHDGPGLTPEEIRHLFEPFVHSDPGEIAAGLGLAAAFGIVKQSRGHIFVESPDGEGRTFRILLPRAAEDEEARGRARARRADVPGRPAAPGSILLVEDDEAVRRTARKILERAGWPILVAVNGNEALEVIDDDTILVLSDVRMPGLNGPGLCRELARLHPDVPVLLMSGYVDVREQIADLDVPLLRKPFTAEALIDAVRTRLSDGPGSAAAD